MTVIIKPPIKAGGNLVKTGSTISDGPALATDVEVTAAVAAHAAGSHASNPPTGGAGGVLSGTYPNPGFAVDMAEQSEVDTALALKAPLASPTFTGIVTLPGDPGSALVAAPKQYVDAQAAAAAAAVVDSSPAVLDTLNELANALGDDPNFATTLTNALALKAPIASPTFTGTVTLPGDPGSALVAAPKQYVDAQAAAVQALAVLLAGAQTITGPKTYEGAAAATVVMAARVAADTQNRWERRADGSQAWGSGAAAVDVVMSRITRGLNLAGKMEVLGQNAVDVPLTIKGFTGQTGNIMEWQDPAGAILGRMASSGILHATALQATGGSGVLSTLFQSTLATGPYLSFAGAAVSVLNRTAVTNVPLNVYGMAGQTGHLQAWRDSVGAILAHVTAGGAFVIPSGMVTSNFSDVTGTGPYVTMAATRVTIDNRTAVSNPMFILRGMAGQTGNLTEWRDSANAVLASITAAGNLAFNTVAGNNIGTAVGQKIGFWNTTPVVQPTAVADASGGAVVDAEARTALNALLTRLRTVGLIAT